MEYDLGSLIVLIAIVVTICIAGCYSLMTINKGNVDIEQYELATFVNDTKTESHYYLFYCSVQEKGFYKCMIKHDGGYKMVELDPTYTIIYEIIDGTEPRIVGKYIENESRFSTRLANTRVYIPTNAILNKFEIDVSK